MKKTAPIPLLLRSLLAAGLLLAGCSDDPPDQKWYYLRSAGGFTVNLAPADTLCEDPGPNFRSNGVDPVETCKGIQKFVMNWERPEDVKDFRGYAIYLDTTPAQKTWKAVQGRDDEADIVVKDHSKAKDGLVFFLYDGNNLPEGIVKTGTPDTLTAGVTRIFGLDTSGRLEEKDRQKRFVFALATRHDGGTQGQPQITYIIAGDRFPPSIFQPAIDVKARSLDIRWTRPTDPTSFFDPGADSGIVLEYMLSVRLDGKYLAERGPSFKPTIRYSVGGVDRTPAVRESVLTTLEGITVGRSWALPDSARAGGDIPAAGDSIHVEVLGLNSRDSILVELFARDSAGNDNDPSMPNVAVITTDTTRPTTPEISVIDSLTTHNGFVVRWTASRDSADLDGNGVLEPGATPNAGIRSYRLIRSPLQDSGSGSGAFDLRDTVIRISEANAGDTVFHDTVRFLPPGRTYVMIVSAVDSTGFISFADSTRVTTDSIRFAGADSGLVCPAGMVPIPSARFRLGEQTGNAAAQKDETGGPGLIRMGSYCIEPYEHRDSLGRFVTKVTWQEADSICRALSPGDSTQLCSEAEWERACEGFDHLQPHLHGIQSETTPSILQASCNQATGDSAMAMSFALREPICLTNEGVYDMAGNLSEWVRDAYRSGAYSSYQDSVMPFGFTFARYTPGDTASIRGGNFLKPGGSVSAAQNLARCSNRDFPMQVRPVTKSECVDPDRRMVAVVYGEGIANVRCFEDSALTNLPITEMLPDPKDSTLVRYFLEGSSGARTWRIPPDTAFRGRKPVAASLTAPTLLEVVFERLGAADTVVDTLDARELRDTSEAVLARILQRESPSQAWAPRKQDGRIQTRRLYAYAITGSKVARPHYANRSIGFRCCGKPRAKPPEGAVAGRP